MKTNGNVALKVEGFEFQDALFEINKSADVIDQEGELKRIVTGYAAVAEVIDSQYEVITREALEAAASDLLHYTTVLYNHDPNRPIGKVLEASPEGTGLFVKVMISDHEDEIWQKITEGVISKFSFRGVVTDYEERFEKSLQRYVTVIKGFRIFEISLVSVPANPQARTLHYYLSKALDLPSTGEVSKDGPIDTDLDEVEDMSNGDVPVANTDQGGRKPAMDKDKAKAIVEWINKLIAALQELPNGVDERLIAICNKIKSEIMAATGEDYPKPNPDEKDVESFDPVMEALRKRMATTEGQIEQISKRLDELAPALETNLLESMKSVAEQLVAERFGELQKQFDEQADVLKDLAEFFEALRPSLGLPAGMVTEPTSTEAPANPTGGEE